MSALISRLASRPRATSAVAALATLVTVAALAGSAAADPDLSLAGPQANSDARNAALARAQVYAARAQDQPSDDDFAACGLAYLDAYNADEAHPDAPDTLLRAAQCFEHARSAGTALSLYEQLGQLPKGQHSAAAGTLRAARLYERLGALERAAAAFDNYARRWPGQPEELPALTSAISLFAAVGDERRQLASLRLASARFSASRPKELAELVLAATTAYERRSLDDAIKHLRAHQALFAAAEPELALRAEGRLAGLLWARSCPGGEDGLCVRTERERGAGLRCDSSDGLRLVVRARPAAVVRQAQDAQRAAIARFEAAAVTQWTAQARHAYALAKLALADSALEQFLAIPFPEGLDFSAKRARLSNQRFSAYLTQKTEAGAKLRAEYEAVIASKDAIAAIAAAARIGTLQQHFAEQLLRAPIPVDVRTGAFAADKSAAYCERITEVVQPILAQTLVSYRACASRAAELGLSSAASRRCQSELSRLEPGSSLAVLESVPPPAATLVPMQAEPAPAPAPSWPAPLREAHATLDVASSSTDAAACGKQASALLAQARGEAAPAARYLAALTYQRCGRSADARPLYQALVTPAGPAQTAESELAARATSNLGLLAWYAGDRAGAMQRWREALTLRPKLFAARLDLAIAHLAEAMADSPATAPQRRQLLAKAEETASLAAAVADHPAALVLLGVLAQQRGQLGVALHLLARARSLDEGAAEVATLQGVLAAEAGEVWLLEPFQRAATAAPAAPETRENLAYALLQLGRWSEARTHLTALPANYQREVALGLAARGLGLLEEAERRYQAALALTPAGAEAELNLGVLWRHYRMPAASDDAQRKAALQSAIAAFRRSALPQAAALAKEATCTLRALERGALPKPWQRCVP